MIDAIEALERLYDLATKQPAARRPAWLLACLSRTRAIPAAGLTDEQRHRRLSLLCSCRKGLTARWEVS